MAQRDLTRYSASDAADAIRTGQFTSLDLVEACLARIAETDNLIRAWAWLDAGFALDQAREMDQRRRSGHATGKLHGVPVGLKDIIDTQNMPTEYGSGAFTGHQPKADAKLVTLLQQAGAVIMGKTKTTEFAFMQPTDTSNPHDENRTPGGSSSGSAAAVAARHVPLAIGSQTGGSVVRPASYCGVYGFKPTRGLISRTGVFRTSETLDHVGVFANSIRDIAILSDAISGHDPNDPASYRVERLNMLQATASVPVAAPRIAWLEFPFLDRLDADAAARMADFREGLHRQVRRVKVPQMIGDLIDVHKTIYDYELNLNMQSIAKSHWTDLSSQMQEAIGRGAAINDQQYQNALIAKEGSKAFFSNIFNNFDAVLTPSATGEAELLSAGHTGDSVFCQLWSLLGLPSLSLPLLKGKNGLPIGVQLVGGPQQDRGLLNMAVWIEDTLAPRL